MSGGGIAGVVDEAEDVPGAARASNQDPEGAQWRRFQDPSPEAAPRYYVGGLACSAIQILLSLIPPALLSRGPAESWFHPPPAFGSSS